MGQTKYQQGQLVHHRLFHYRGVIVKADETFKLTEAWYRSVARSRPPKDQPWYHVLVHNGTHQTYVAERNLVPDASEEPIRHPALDQHFNVLSGGRYEKLLN
jgi:heat shock protein HspQ